MHFKTQRENFVYFFLLSPFLKKHRHHTLPNIHLIIFDLEKKFSSWTCQKIENYQTPGGSQARMLEIGSNLNWNLRLHPGGRGLGLDWATEGPGQLPCSLHTWCSDSDSPWPCHRTPHIARPCLNNWGCTLWRRKKEGCEKIILCSSQRHTTARRRIRRRQEVTWMSEEARQLFYTF